MLKPLSRKELIRKLGPSVFQAPFQVEDINL